LGKNATDKLFANNIAKITPKA